MVLAILLDFVGRWGAIILLVLLSATFSGLTLGLLSLDLIGLEVVIESGTPKESKYAKRIYRIRKRGNLLLCTLLLGNVMVNALLSILLAGITSGIIGLIASSALIVVFGEIIPQALCSRSPLPIGYYTAWLVWIFLLFLFPLAWPISLVLDWILGRELGTIYSRQELKKLMEIHHSTGSVLSEDETTLLSGALDFHSKQVEHAMTPLDKVFMLDKTKSKLDADTIALILQKGHSRIPVYEEDAQNIEGILLVKDMVLLNPEDELDLETVMRLYGRPLPRVWADTPLGDMLKEFKVGKSHIAAVRRVNADGPGDPFYEVCGIVTLEDVIEEIIQDEIIDETDFYLSNVNQPHEAPIDYRNFASGIIAQQQSPGGAPMTEEEIQQTLKDLSTVHEFREEVVSSSVLQKLIAQCVVNEAAAGHQIYTKGQESPYFIFILSGEIQTTTQGGISSQGPRSLLGIDALLPDSETFVPDFSACVASPSARYFKISSNAFQAAVQATALERRA